MKSLRSSAASGTTRRARLAMRMASWPWTPSHRLHINVYSVYIYIYIRTQNVIDTAYMLYTYLRMGLEGVTIS